MRILSLRSVVLSVFVLMGNLFGYWTVEGHCQKVASYQTEDGWTIYGTLRLPEKASDVPVPGVVLVTEPEWVIRSIYGGLAQNISKRGMAVLSIDVRGTGQSEGGKHYFAFSAEEQKKMQLDIRGAIQFLSAQKGVDPHRIALLGAGIAAHYAALEASVNPAIQALVFLSGELGEPAREFLKSRSDVPILCVVDKKDRESFKEMTEAYYLSKNEDSDFVLSVDHGPVMFWHVGGLEEQIAGWLADNVKAQGTETEVSFTSEDGWVLHGRLWMPEGGTENSKIPGVVLVHGANHDQGTYYLLARAVAKKGMAALTFDWRGKNQSSKAGAGTYGVNMQPEERTKVYLDVRAAIGFLASQKQVDADRIGLVAATFGSGRAVHAASLEPRVKAIVLLTAYNLSPEGKQYLQSGKVPILTVASSEDINYGADNLAEVTRQAYKLSGNKESEFRLYDNAGRGSEMLKTRPELQTVVVRWFAEKLESKPSGLKGTGK